MAGAMRKMGIYLGLVEDDDRAAYGRYDARQSDYDDVDDRHARDDRRGDRRDRYGYPEDRAGDHFDSYAQDDHRSPELLSEEVPAAELSAPAPVVPRRSTGARRLDLAPSAGLGRAPGSPVGSSGLAVREAAPEPPVAPVAPPVVAAPVVKPYKITTLHPRTYNEARTIGERFREGLPVIMNLSDMDDADAKRLVDFAAGLSFGLHGSIERVTAKVFLISPQGTDVTAEDKARIREGGFFNQS